MRTLQTLLFVCLCWGAARPSAATPIEERAQIEQWIQELGAESFSQREQAAAALRAAAGAARPALQQAVLSKDLEIRDQAQRLLSQLVRREFEQKIERFASDIRGELQHQLPGWEAFRKLVGSSRGARLLFVEMIRQEESLLIAIERQEGVLQQATARIELLYRSGKQSIAQLATMLLAVNSASKSEASGLSMQMYRLLLHQQAKDSVKNRSELRTLFSAWLAKAISGPGDKGMLLQLVLQFGDAKLGVEYGRRVISDAKQSSSARAKAAICLARFGDRSDIPRLLPLLSEERLIHTWSRNNSIIRTQLRDRALSLLVHMVGKEPAEFGFPHPMPNDDYIFQLYSCGFENDGQRKKAHAQWEKWWADNKQTVLAGS